MSKESQLAGTYKVAVAKMPTTASFIFSGKCKLQTIGTGMNRIKKSVMMLKYPPATAMLTSDIQRPSVNGCHALCTGVHAKMMRRVLAIVYIVHMAVTL